MGWIVNPSIGKKLRSAVTTLEVMNRTTMVLREPMEPARFKTFLSDTLLLSEKQRGSAEDIVARVSETIALPCAMPDDLARDNRFEINRVSIQLARHLGVDPIRLMLAAYDAWAKASDGDASIHAEIKRSWGRQRQRGRADRLDIQIDLGGGALWRGSRMTLRRTVMPDAVVNALPGRNMADIVSHPWPGWRDISIVGASVSGDSLLIETDARDVVTTDDFKAI